MKGDFSRDSFDLRKNFSRVLMQQGRVQLDADFNEQSSILLHYLRTLTSDLIGQHAGPPGSFVVDFSRDDNGVILLADDGKPKDLTISTGRYYVDGILCENEEMFNGKPVSYFNQPYLHFPDDEDKKLPAVPFIVYLDVWERHVTGLEDESLTEVALGGIDTTTRSQIVWQVRARAVLPDDGNISDPSSRCETVKMPAPSKGHLKAGVLSNESDDPCNIAPDSRYRGAENQLYRVEIHRGNVDELGKLNEVMPTFKWSRENGSVIFPVISITVSSGTTEVRLAHLGRDDKFTLREGDWVEIVDDNYTLRNRHAKLLKVSAIDRDEMSVTLIGTTEVKAEANSKNHALLRRWDQKTGDSSDRDLKLDDDNALKIIEVEDTDENNWLMLEDGIRIQFVKTDAEKPRYRTGDYWLIPARTATGDVVWSKKENGKPQMQPPNGIEHHYSPLAIVDHNGVLSDCHNRIIPIPDLAKMVEVGRREAVRAEDAKPEAVKTKPAKTKNKKPTE